MGPYFVEVKPILIVGSHSTSEDDLLNTPFAGRAGDLLRSIIDESGVGRDSCHFTNAVKCFTKESNRTPYLDRCKYWLWQEMKAVRPSVILTMGRDPTRLLLDLKKSFKLGEYAYRFHEVSYTEAVVGPTHSPEFVMSNGLRGYARLLDFLREAKRKLYA